MISYTRNNISGECPSIHRYFWGKIVSGIWKKKNKKKPPDISVSFNIGSRFSNSNIGIVSAANVGKNSYGPTAVMENNSRTLQTLRSVYTLRRIFYRYKSPPSVLIILSDNGGISDCHHWYSITVIRPLISLDPPPRKKNRQLLPIADR